MNPSHVSVYFHDKAVYICPECGKDLDRAAIHGWFWSCATCKKTFPLKDLEQKKETPQKSVEKPVEEKGFLSRMKDKLLGKEIV